MLSRMWGASNAKGPALVFIDCHMEVMPGYLEPLLDRIGKNRNASAIPMISSLNRETLQFYYRTDVATFGRHGFAWNMVKLIRNFNLLTYENNFLLGSYMDRSSWIREKATRKSLWTLLLGDNAWCHVFHSQGLLQRAWHVRPKFRRLRSWRHWAELQGLAVWRYFGAMSLFMCWSHV